jgi:Rieske Fe-S protein
MFGGGRHLHPFGMLSGDKFTGPQPSLPDDWQGGFLCACHGSTFDLAGRVFKNKPAPDNLEVPPHMYLSESKSAHRRRQEGLKDNNHG